MKALIVVDVQNDFCEGGSLAVTGGFKVAQDVSEHIRFNVDKYALVVATKDYHTPGQDNGGHFSDHPDFAGTWPAHCLSNGIGADFAMPLHEGYFDDIFYKGQGVPAYSGFAGRNQFGDSMHKVFRNRGIDSVRIFGIAFDYCVKETALGAASLGYKTSVAPGYCAAVADWTTTSKELLENGVVLE